MSKLISIAVLGTASLLAFTAQAQRVMGGRGPAGAPRISSPMRGGPVFRGGPAFRSNPGFRSAPVVRPLPVAPAHRFVGSRPVFFNNRPFRPFHPAHHFRSRRFVFGTGCFGTFGFPCSNFVGGGFFLGGPYYPYGYYPLFPEDYYPQQPAPQPVVVSTGNEAALTAEIQRLSDEIHDLREDQSRARTEERQPAPPGTAISAVTPSAATVFVFRDGRRISAQNYAIAGQTLWVLNEHVARKMSLAELDRTATQQANAASGVELHLPEPAPR